jgi:glyoxylase-like metal-dependent hydrolase (beta-lactamase superfamily II)
MEALDGAVDHPTLTVVYSHGDWDHVWGTSGITLPIADIISHPTCAHRFEKELPATLEAMAEAHPDLYRAVDLVPPTTLIDSETSIPLGGLTLELEPMPGHTPDTLVGFVPEAGVFLGGDAVESPLPFLNEASPIDEWRRGRCSSSVIGRSSEDFPSS